MPSLILWGHYFTLTRIASTEYQEFLFAPGQPEQVFGDFSAFICKVL